MPLFIDRLPFHQWTDPTRTPALTYWTVVLPMILAEPTLMTPPPVASAPRSTGTEPSGAVRSSWIWNLLIEVFIVDHQ